MDKSQWIKDLDSSSSYIKRAMDSISSPTGNMMKALSATQTLNASLQQHKSPFEDTLAKMTAINALWEDQFKSIAKISIPMDSYFKSIPTMDLFLGDYLKNIPKVTLPWDAHFKNAISFHGSIQDSLKALQSPQLIELLKDINSNQALKDAEAFEHLTGYLNELQNTFLQDNSESNSDPKNNSDMNTPAIDAEFLIRKTIEGTLSALEAAKNPTEIRAILFLVSHLILPIIAGLVVVFFTNIMTPKEPNTSLVEFEKKQEERTIRIEKSLESFGKTIEKFEDSVKGETTYRTLYPVWLMDLQRNDSGKILQLQPQQIVALIRDDKKWIYVMAYNANTQSISQGWVKKKYFKRINNKMSK